MAQILEFGESLPDYPVRVINEREARAGAGILFFAGLIAFQNAFTTGDFTMTRMVILAFAVDFFIRVLINPRYAPSLVLGRFMVRKQTPEYVGAPQKRFAWGLGLAIAVFMMVWTFGLNQAGPVALLGCVTCIILLFFETAFGICVGCKIYNLIHREKAQLCPGGVCEVAAPRVQRLGAGQLATLAAMVAFLAVAAPFVSRLDQPVMGRATDVATGGAGDACEVPQFARLIGHEEQWRLHNGCS